MLAQVIAAGVSAGFSGKWDTIKALARQLDVPISGRDLKGGMQELEAAFHRLEGKKGPQWR